MSGKLRRAEQRGTKRDGAHTGSGAKLLYSALRERQHTSRINVFFGTVEIAEGNGTAILKPMRGNYRTR